MILASIWYVVVYWNPNMHMCDQMKSLVKITLGRGVARLKPLSNGTCGYLTRLQGKTRDHTPIILG
jgi:hypothetical protein